VDEDAMHRGLAPALRARGFDVVTVFESGLASAPDDAVLAYAARDGRAVYTFNVGDFCRLHGEYLRQGADHAGIIVVSRQRYLVGEQVRRLLRLLSAKSAEDMKNQLEFL
jgi:hypothetical protein